MTQPTRELVLSKIQQHFPQEDLETVLTLLDEYGVEKYEVDARNRVQLAVLKASNGNREALRFWIGVAKSDFRDVLVAAEYPNMMKVEVDAGVGAFDAMSKEQQTAIEEADLQQYNQWLQSVTRAEPPAV